jgi:hypothetical protein
MESQSAFITAAKRFLGMGRNIFFGKNIILGTGAVSTSTSRS